MNDQYILGKNPKFQSKKLYRQEKQDNKQQSISSNGQQKQRIRDYLIQQDSQNKNQQLQYFYPRTAKIKRRIKHKLRPRRNLTQVYTQSGGVKFKDRFWTKQQDEKLKFYIEKIGGRWAQISKLMKSKSAKSCRIRWLYYVNPTINNSKLSLYEEWLLFLAVRTIGTKWAQISKLFDHRPDDHLRVHWNKRMKQAQIKLFEQTLSTLIIKKRLQEIVKQVIDQKQN